MESCTETNRALEEKSFIFETKAGFFTSLELFCDSIPEKVEEEFVKSFGNNLRNLSEERLKGKIITMQFDPERQQLTLLFSSEKVNFPLCQMSSKLGVVTQIVRFGVENVLKQDCIFRQIL
mgnify:CR=1 FL=1